MTENFHSGLEKDQPAYGHLRKSTPADCATNVKHYLIKKGQPPMQKELSFFGKIIIYILGKI